MSPTNMQDKAMAMKSNQWEDLYILAEHWESDLRFYSDDLRFLHHLVDKYFIWITKSENLELVRELMLQILHLEKECKELLEKVLAHKSELSQFSMEGREVSIAETGDHHRKLRSEISDFVKGFRSNRTEVFRITEYVIDSEELSGLMSS